MKYFNHLIPYQSRIIALLSVLFVIEDLIDKIKH